MVIRPIHAYVTGTSLVAAGLLSIQDWTVLQYLTAQEIVGLISLAVLGIASEAVAIKLKVGESPSQASLTFIPVLATVLLFGPSIGVALAAVIILVSQFILHRKPPIRAIFNLSQWIAACAVSGFAYTGVRTLLGLPRVAYPEPMTDGWLLVPFAVFVLFLFFVNYIAVAGAISLDAEKKFAKVLRQILGAAGANVAYGVLISPIAFVVAVLYGQFDFRPLGISVALLPLIFVRKSYLTNLQLQAANQDLLKALVKAIETRDPYTSGHSLRVSGLARKIAVRLGLSHRKVEEIETAALLHDIGKIDAVYVEILRKPDNLSEEEREIIESHVTKGVELLESISSFPTSVVAAVRYHHEREDGNGYPEGLVGRTIPIGAKIIKVCDAVDAMLSDRPYRGALALEKVREQLITYAGTQFDVEVVSVAIRGSILAEHREAVSASRGRPPLTILDGKGEIDDATAKDLTASVRTMLSSWGSHKSPSHNVSGSI